MECQYFLVASVANKNGQTSNRKITESWPKSKPTVCAFLLNLCWNFGAAGQTDLPISMDPGREP